MKENAFKKQNKKEHKRMKEKVFKNNNNNNKPTKVRSFLFTLQENLSFFPFLIFFIAVVAALWDLHYTLGKSKPNVYVSWTQMEKKL